MSQSYDGRDMDQPPQSSKLAKRSRERGPAGLPRNPRSPVSQPQVTQEAGLASPGLVSPPAVASPKSLGPRAISRPTPVPQWPLPGPPASSEPYRLGLPPNRSRKPPKRPPRPSYVPPLVDQPPSEEPTAPFRAPPSVPPQEYGEAYNPLSPSYVPPIQPPSPAEPLPEPLVPVVAPYAGHSRRRSANLGPPPSSRRGQSSFYSNQSFVSPIPEEAHAFRSHESYASSAAMPDALRAGPVVVSPGRIETFYEESVAAKSRDSVGSTLVASRSTPEGHRDRRQSPSPINPFDGASGSIDESIDSSNAFYITKHTPATTPGTASNVVPPMPNSLDPMELRKAAGSPQPYSRLSAIRRPPRLDIDAVKAAEARGSLTSLPDLIRRATRLAAMMEKGRRPASRLDELDFFNEKGSMAGWERQSYMDSRHQSSLSDMLAAFPPPVHTAGNPGHTRAGSWPLLNGRKETALEGISDIPKSQLPAKKQGRRCCGLPVWGFILVILLMLCIIAAAVVLPLEFFVFKNLGNKGNSAMTQDDCQTTLPCLNGGTSVVFQNTCSCICTNGFTGADCNTGGSSGCTTTNLVATDGSSRIDNVTLGMAIPRIIADSSANFSIPLSGTSILAKFNSANLSCIAQNSLVTFDGQSTRIGGADTVAQNSIDSVANARVNSLEDFVSVSVITFSPTPTTTMGLDATNTGGGHSTTTAGGTPTGKPLFRRASSSASTSTSTSTSPSSTPSTMSTFNVTEEVLDFARTAVLFVLEEVSIDAANTAQTQLQQFFSKASKGLTQLGNSVTVQQASNLNIGGNYTVNLVGGTVNLGRGPIGGMKTSKRNIISDPWDELDTIDSVARPGQSTFPRGLTSCA